MEKRLIPFVDPSIGIEEANAASEVIKSKNLVEGKNSRKVVKEERTYVDPAQARMLEIMNYKPKS